MEWALNVYVMRTNSETFQRRSRYPESLPRGQDSTIAWLQSGTQAATRMLRENEWVERHVLRHGWRKSR
jgi:hypothetical protein